jgi:hypothetical protein
MGTLAIMEDTILEDILVFGIMGQASTSDCPLITPAISGISAITLTTGDMRIGVGLATSEGDIHGMTTFDISIGKGVSSPLLSRK